MVEEWARSVDDILVRRAKHGLHPTEVEKDGFRAWMTTAVADAAE